jgi:hypothetical protein
LIPIAQFNRYFNKNNYPAFSLEPEVDPNLDRLIFPFLRIEISISKNTPSKWCYTNHMNLSEFITNTLKDIRIGVEDSNTKERDAKEAVKYVLIATERVEFDLAVTVENASEGSAEAKAGIIKVAEASIDGKISTQESNITRVKFKVNIWNDIA